MRAFIASRHRIIVAYHTDEYDEEKAKTKYFKEDTLGDGPKQEYYFSSAYKCHELTSDDKWTMHGIAAVYSADAGNPDAKKTDTKLVHQYAKELYSYLVEGE